MVLAIATNLVMGAAIGVGCYFMADWLKRMMPW